jgi:hypothetical protein
MGMLDDTPSPICGMVLEHGQLNREGVRRLIEVSIEFYARFVSTHLGELIGSIKLRVGRESRETGEWLIGEW